MPGKIKVKILAGRNLPVMDRSGDTTDAYVELKFGNTTYKTDVCRKSLNPQWNSEWYKFEVDDADLQDEPLQIRLMDHDTYSANDAIGKVYINLNPLLLPGVPPTVKNMWTLEAAMNTNTGSQTGSVMTGWIPVYDTMHGIRGEVNIIVKVELFSDFNKFRQSSCGVQFFYSPNIPYGYHTQSIHGFVEELVVSDDPEYKWIDKIRTPRASNEARQTLFFKLSGEVQRKIGLKALDLGGNAVIGYLQNFDLEGESGIVARGIGTAVTLVKTQDIFNFPPDSVNLDEVALAYYSQSKSQTERTGITPNRTSYPTMTDKRHVRLSDHFSRHKPAPRSPSRVGRRFEYKRADTVQESYPQSMRLNKSCVGLGKSTTSYSSLSQAVIDDASVRMMLAQEDERGEYGKSRLDASIKNFKRLFSTNEPDVKFDSNSRLNNAPSKPNSARSSIVSLGNFKSEKFAKGNKATEGIAALLIKSIHVVPLEHVQEAQEPRTSSPTTNADKEACEDPTERKEAGDDQAERREAMKGRSSRAKARIRRQQATDTADELDLSFEENTPTSESEASNENASYDVLRDSPLSSDEEAAMSDRLGKPLSRAVTFPLTKVKFVRKRLQRVDSDTRPLHEGSTASLVRCLSENEISDARFSSRLVIDVTRKPTLFDGNSKREVDAPVSRSEAVRSEFLRDFAKVLDDQQGTDNLQDFNCPIATSTPMEIRPPFFPPNLESDEPPNASNNPDKPVSKELPGKEDVKSSDLQDSFDGHCRKEFEDHRQVPEKQETGTTNCDTSQTCENGKSEKASAVSSINDNNKNNNEDPQQGTFTYPYTVLPNATDVEVKEEDKQPTEEDPLPALEKSESFKRKELTLQIKGQDTTSNTFTTSTHSLPSLSYYPLPETEDQNQHRREEIARSMSTIRSSIESLLQFSSNDTLSTMRKDRQKCMLDLIRIIDTKMMTHQPHGANDRARRKRHERAHRSPNPVETPKPHHRQLLRKHFRRSTILDFTRVCSIPSNLSLSSSTFAAPKTDSSSHVSSLDSLNTRDIRSSRLRTTIRTSSSAHASILARERSAVDPGEVAARDLTVETQSSDSPRNASSIELKELKSRDTNNLTSFSDAFVDHPAFHECRRASNVREVSGSNGGPTNSTNTANITDNSCVSRPCPVRRHQDEGSLSPSYPLPTVSPMVTKVCQSPANKPQLPAPLHRRSSDSDLSITPKGNSLGGSDRSMGGLLKSTAGIRTMNQDALEMLEYPFITMQQYPPGFIIHVGGLVSSRSVKLLERISNLEEPEGRDAWWKEIRMEVRSHARALACNVVIGYKEETSICDDVCVLNASGTAAVINLHHSNAETDSLFLNKLQGSVAAPADGEREKPAQKPTATKTEKSESETTTIPTIPQQTGKVRHLSEGKDHEVFGTQSQTKCNLCHLPYSESSVPFRVSVSKCVICKRAKVPDVMFTTVELPENMPTTGRGCFIQATVCKNKKDLRGELNAKDISDCLPFLEYELHSLLLNKLKVKGMNGIFGLKLQVSVGERLIVGMAVGTAVFLTALPPPSVPQIASLNSWHNEEQLAEIQKNLLETVKKNREFYRLKPVGDVENGRANTSDTDESDEDLPDLDFSVGTRDTCVLEVDDIEDMDRISLLMDERPPNDFHVVNTQSIPGLEDLEIVRNLQMFTQISRAKIPTGQSASMPSKYFARLLQSVYFKLRRMVPCAVCDMQFKLALPEPDEIQLTVVGMALGLGDPVKVNKFKKKLMSHSASKDQVKKPDDSELIFSLDVDHTEAPGDNTSSNALGNSTLSGVSGPKARPRSPLRTKTHITHRYKHVPLKGRYGVDITPLSYLPGGRIERYLGNLNFFFIRESTSIRENGGLSGFTHSFVMEVLAIVRAHITALGGNAMVAFFMTQCVLLHSPHKNQGQCLINVGGDVVSVSYFADEKHSGVSNC